MPTTTATTQQTISVKVYKPSAPGGTYAGAMPMYNKLVNSRQRTWDRVPKHLRLMTNPYLDNIYQERLGYINRSYSYYSSGVLQYDYPQVAVGELKLRDDGAFPGRGTALLTFMSTTTALAVAQNSVLGKCKGASWNLPVFTAEANKTIDLIASTAKRIATGFRAMKRGQPDKAWKALGFHPTRKQRQETLGVAARDNWLAYRYGWIPLLSDVKSAAEFAASQLTTHPPVRRFSALCSAGEQKEVGVQNQDIFLGTTGWDADSTYTVLRTGEAKAWITVQLMGNQSARTMSQLGMDPWQLGWELLPYSFVADWFVNVGQFLELQSALAGLQILDAGYSTMASAEISFNLHGPNQTTQYWSTVSTGKSEGPKATKRGYSRSKWINPSVNLLFNPKLNQERIADAVALLGNAFSKKR